MSISPGPRVSGYGWSPQVTQLLLYVPALGTFVQTTTTAAEKEKKKAPRREQQYKQLRRLIIPLFIAVDRGTFGIHLWLSASSLLARV